MKETIGAIGNVVDLSNSNQYLKVVFSRKYKQIDSNNN